MTSDYFINHCGADYFALQREYHARGFSGESHEMVVMRLTQAWRLLDGPELAFSWLDLRTPAAHMRYWPYQTTEDT